MPETQSNRTDKNTLKIFISYSRRDLAHTDNLVLALEKAGFEVLIDRRDLPYGEEWQKELAYFIGESDIVLWLVSRASVESKWVRWELGEVGRLGKRLVTVKIDDVRPDQLPESIGRIHLLPSEGLFNLQQHRVQLVQALHADRAWIKSSTQLANQARKWIASQRDRSQLLRGFALRDAENWAKGQTATSPKPPSETFEFILVSRRAATSRRRWWITGTIVLVAVVTQIGLVSLFFRLDSSINQARNTLKSGRIVDARRQVEAVLTSPVNRLLATTSSANSLARETLDFGVAEVIHRFETGPLARLSGGILQLRGELMVTKDRLFGSFSNSPTGIVLRCNSDGGGCSSAPVANNKEQFRLLKDDNYVYVLSVTEGDDGQDVRVGKVPHDGSPATNMLPANRSRLAQFNTIAESLVWQGKHFATAVGGDGEFFSESPPLHLGGGLDAVASPISLFAMTDGTANPLRRPPILKRPAVCSLNAEVCLTAEVDPAASARGDISEFNLWRRNPTSRDGDNAQKTNANIHLTRVIKELFQPTPSRNAIAISPDGRWAAIGENNLLHIWSLPRLTLDRAEFTPLGKNKPTKTFDLGRNVQAVVFGGVEGLLFALTDNSVVKINHLPRAQVVKQGADVQLREISVEAGRRGEGPLASEVEQDRLSKFRKFKGANSETQTIIDTRAIAVRELGSGNYLAFLRNKTCKPQGENDEQPGTLAFLAANGTTLLAQYVLNCVASFPDLPYGHLKQVGIQRSDNKYLIGAYGFSGLLSWDTLTNQLAFLQLRQTLAGQNSNVRIADFSTTGEGQQSARTIDFSLRSLRIDSFVGATTIMMANKGRRAIFYRYGNGSSGHSRFCWTLDLDTMVLRGTPNLTENFFDYISDAKLSPSGDLVLTYKKASDRYELFRFTDMAPISLPDGIRHVAFKSDVTLELRLQNGSQLLWHVPDAQNEESSWLKRLLAQ